MYYWCTILLAINPIIFLFFYEETKFMYKGDIELFQIIPNALQGSEEYNVRDDKTRLESSQSTVTTAFPSIN